MILPIRERFTHAGSSSVEAQIREIVQQVAETVEREVAANEYHALVLIGGYGRGEGGVRRERGVEAPNNNLDFLLITRRASAELASSWQQQIDQQLKSLQQRYHIGIDFSIVSGRTLQRSPSRIMWYDMRGGHKTVLGDANYVSSLNHFRIDRVPAWDVHNLLVNRGTLLIINDCLPAEDKSPELRQLATRHAVKAIIGYGDALLHSYGQYHWSYVEKQRRMLLLRNVDTAFQELYDKAAEFRFHPNTTATPDFLHASNSVREQCEAVHLRCESRRLGTEFPNWDDYLEVALRAGIREDTGTTWGILRGLRAASRSRSAAVGDSRLARLGQRMLSPQRVLALLFPAVIYRTCSEAYQTKAAYVLRADGTSPEELRRAYLRVWGEAVDRNFGRFLERFKISLNTQESSL